MTISHRVSVLVLALLAAVAVTFGAGWIGYQSAHAEGAGSALLAPIDAGSASAPAAAPAKPADQLHDPVSSPGAAWDDLRAAQKVGWPLVVFAALIMLAKLAGRAGAKFSWLAMGKTPVIVGALGAIAASCYNAAATGGAWTATAFAGLMGLSHYIDAGGKPLA